MKNIGLYIHVPFCVKKCNYCDFYSMQGTKEAFEKFVSDTEKGIFYWYNEALSEKEIDTIYIGGGTPSILGTELLKRILYTINTELNVSKDVEVTIEMNPNSANTLDLLTLKSYGLNRISMGLQSANDEELRLLGRSHTLSDAQFAIESFHKAGINNFSLDVMLGIPLQNYDSLENTLKFCVDSQAQHISTYMLKIEENTKFYENPDNLIFADDDKLVDFYDFTCKYLKANAFRHYEISNFCKNDKISRHNMKYWMLDEYLGIGPSAHSLLNGERFYYPSDINIYDSHDIVMDSDGGTAEEYIMLSLRTDKGFEFNKYKELFSLNPSAEFIAKAKKFEKLGLLTINDKSIALTEKGYLVSNTIIYDLINTEI